MLGERLKNIRDGKGLTLKAFATALGTSPGFLSEVENGKKMPGFELIDSLKRIYAVDLNWLLTGEDESINYLRAQTIKEEHSDDYAGYIQVPRYEIAASAGGGTIVQSEQIVDHLAFKGSWLKNQLGLSPANVAVISVFGDSMEPYLADGDLILIDTSIDRVKNDSVYVLQYGESLLVKRLQIMRDGSVIVKSDNERYEPETFRGDSINQLRVVGRLVRRLVR